jgi:ribosomal protein L34E
MKQKVCVECKARPARYWGSNICEECYREMLKEKLENEG